MNAHLAKLVTALRAEMPKEFTWYFGAISVPTECGSMGCALGLAGIVLRDDGFSLDDEKDEGTDMAEFFGMDRDLFDATFLDPTTYIDHHGATSCRDVTPAMVADEIEHPHTEGDEA